MNHHHHDNHLMIPGLDPPEEFAGGEVIAAIRTPVDVSTYPRRHVIVVKHVHNGHQTFSTHDVAHDHEKWVSGQGHYDLTWSDAVHDMMTRAILAAH